MKSFDDFESYLKKEGLFKSLSKSLSDDGKYYYPVLNDAFGVFEAGQQSKQAVIDSLHKNIDALHAENERLQKEYSMMFEGVQGRQKTIDCCQETLSRIESLVRSERGNITYCDAPRAKGFFKEILRIIGRPDPEEKGAYLPPLG